MGYWADKDAYVRRSLDSRTASYSTSVKNYNIPEQKKIEFFLWFKRFKLARQLLNRGVKGLFIGIAHQYAPQAGPLLARCKSYITLPAHPNWGLNYGKPLHLLSYSRRYRR